LAGEGGREKERNAEAQSRREEHETDSVVACRAKAILLTMPRGVPCCHPCNAAVSAAVLRASRPQRGQDAAETAGKMPVVQDRLRVVRGLCGSSLSRP